MSTRLRRGIALGAVFLCCVTAMADTAVPDDEIAALQAIFDMQQQRLGELQERVDLVNSQDMNSQRNDAMRAQIREILSDPEFRESLTPTTLQAGYDKGFFIRSSDNKFSLKFSSIIHFRWTHYDVGSQNRYTRPRLQRNDRTGFDINRARFRFMGHVYDENLTYLFSLTHATDSRYDVRSIYAWLNYKFADEFNITLGQMRLASTRAQMSPITRYQFTELPFSDALFGCGCGIGVRFWGQLFDKRVTYWLDVTNSWSGTGNRTITTDPPELDSVPSVLLRVVWHALGENPGKEFPNQSDTGFHETPALDIGFHYGFSEDESDLRTSRIPFRIPRPLRDQGAFGLASSSGMQIHTLGYEVAFQYRGFSAISELHVRMLDPRRAGRLPFTPWWQFTRVGEDTSFYGGYLQAGYFLPIPGMERKLELAARVEGIGGIDPGNEGAWIYTAGVNYFINEKVKLQADVSKIEEVPITSGVYGLANVNDQPLIFRVQLQFAF